MNILKNKLISLKIKYKRFTSKFVRLNTLFNKLNKGLELLLMLFVMLLIKIHSGITLVFSPIFKFINKYFWSPLCDFLYATHNIPRSRSAVLLASAILCMLIWTASVFSVAFEVSVDGKSIGFIKTEDDIAKAISLIETQTSELLGRPYSLDANISYQLKPVTGNSFISKGDTIMTPKEMSRYLSTHVDAVSTLAVVSIDGEVVGAVGSEEQAQAVLDQIASTYTGGDKKVKYDFVEDVAVNVIETTTNIAMNTEDLRGALTGTEDTIQTYTISDNDTLSGVAKKFGMSTSEITKLNPNIIPTKMRGGDKVIVSAPEPKLSVLTSKNISYNETIPYQTIKNKNSTMPKNQTKTIKEGKSGSANVSAKIMYINGVESERIIEARTVLNNPQDKVVEVGTRNISQGTGSMLRPFNGNVTSKYGYRGREFHTGVDLAGSSGSSIKAADSGKVIFSGRNGNYGNCIIISHGKGIETLYAHNSKNLVRVGDSVDKGDIIGRVGSTGRSTGSHVHVEVRVNGRHVNPRNYFKY